jgi:hypothetical protein
VNAKIINFLFISHFFLALHCWADEPVEGPIKEISCGYDFALVEKNVSKLIYGDSAQIKKELEGMAYKYRVIDVVVDELPTIALRIGNTWLLGSSYLNVSQNRLQGGLGFRNSKGETERLLNEPVEDIYAMPFGYVVVTQRPFRLASSLRQFDWSSGAIYVVDVSADSVSISNLFELSEQPSSSWQTKAGAVIINFPHSSILLSIKASIKNIVCTDYEYEENDK